MFESSIELVVETIVTPQIHRSLAQNRPIVIMTCGLAGSGKTTLAKAIQHAHSTIYRLSGDEIIFEQHGIYGVDYEASPALYAKYQDEKDKIYLTTFRDLLAERKNVILERSFYAKEDRDEYRKIAEDAGASVLLVFLKAEGEQGKEVLWKRICKRSEGVKTADSALDISRETFDEYWNGFEDPVGEGEVVVRVL